MASAIVHPVVCAQCGKREAAVFIRRHADARHSEGESPRSGDLALCESCARARGFVVGKGRIELNIGEILDSALDGSRLSDVSGSQPARCPSCGLSLHDVRRDGRLGCSACVEAFRPFLRKVLDDRLPSSQLMVRVPGPGAERDREAPKAGSPRNFPFDLPAFAAPSPASEAGADSDVVLRSTAVVSRNFASLPFVGGADALPSRSLFLELAPSLPGLTLRELGSLPSSSRRSLSERSFVSRSYAADPEAPLAASETDPVYLLSDDGEHLRFVSRLRGFDGGGALALAESYAADFGSRLPSGLEFARDGEFGWICSHLEECGSAEYVGATLHLPALVMTGLHDRFFKTIMSRGAIVRGLYSSEDEISAGSVFDIIVTGEGARISPRDSQLELLETFVSAAVQAERSARSSLRSGGLEAVRDAAGRAFGILRYALRVESGEGLQYLSRLRLAALLGFLEGVDADDLGGLFEELGPGSLARGAGLDSISERGHEDSLRARRLRAVFADAAIGDGGY
ncbi:MAG TPA: hypothetical protein VMV90_06845 [Rectinemataceae bacterium]|nr:hypothetical protein [Rectinemataceae bacterium]